jgi:hypothetical protein
MMFRHNFHLLCVALLSTSVAGCFGVAVIHTTECRSDVPICGYFYEKDKWGPQSSPKPNPLPIKDDFIKIWGEPSETQSISENEVILVYKRELWCGVVPSWGVLIPLVLPTCDGFDRITFKDNRATHIHFKRENLVGGYFLLTTGIGDKSKTCPVPCSHLNGTLSQPQDR